MASEGKIDNSEGFTRITLHGFDFAKPVPGEHMRLYVYGKDAMHSGALRFAQKPRKDEHDILEAMQIAIAAWANNAPEIRITNCMDELLFRCTRTNTGETDVAYPEGETLMNFFMGLVR